MADSELAGALAPPGAQKKVIGILETISRRRAYYGV